MKWTFLACWVIGSLFLYVYGIRLKEVRLDAQALLISNLKRQIVVPLRDIATVRENRWLNIHPVTIEFLRPTEFGEQIVFMPHTRWFALWSSHPVVREIQDAVARARGTVDDSSAA